MSFTLNKTYSFNTIAPGILGASFDSMKVIGIINYEEASRFEDIISIHSKIVNTVPNVSLPMSYQDCTYIKFETSSGLKKILALEYIDLDSVQEKQTKQLVITVNNYTLSDATTITNMLKDAGFWDIKVSMQ